MKSDYQLMNLEIISTCLAQVVDETDERHCKSFTSLFGKSTTEKNLPSKKTGASRIPNIPFNPCKQHTVNTNVTISCYECNKPHLIYSQNKVFPNITSKFKRITKYLLYICGIGIAEVVGPGHFKELYIKENPKSTMVAEGLCCSVSYPACCCYCAITKNLLTL